MRRNKIVGYGTFFALAVSVGLGALQLHHKAAASTFGRALYQGYYDGQTYAYPTDKRFVDFDGLPMSWNTPANSTNVNLFIQGVSDYLNNTGPNPALVADHQAEYADARASILINTMMGIQANDPRYSFNPALPRWQNGVILAKQIFSAWATIVSAYGAGTIAGASVEWNASIHSTTSDLIGVGIALCNTGTCDAGVDRGAIRQEVPDISFVPATDEIKDAIIFHHPDGTTYSIQKWSGDLIGDESPFPQNWLQVPKLVTSVPSGAITTGAVLNFVGTATNAGTNPSIGGVLTGNLTIDGVAQPPLALGVFAALGPGATTGPLSFSYTIPAFSAAGTQYCFYAGVSPHSFTDPGTGVSIPMTCYTVGYARSPSVQGLNGDVQAGGGICGQQLFGGTITGNAGGSSYSDYVVAATGLVSNFQSAGAIGGKELTVGANGGYSQACRPDLLQVALNGRAATSATIPTGSGRAAVDLGTLTRLGSPGVYYYDGQTLDISGIAHAKVTIIATVGTIRIVGPVLLDNGQVPARLVPSVGLIAQKDILMDPIVTRVDAYLFANRVIDTCDAHDSSCTTPQLVVDGFLMAHSIHFNRLGALNSTGAQVAEKIILTPQLYINPPKFFDTDVTRDILQAGGEKPPLF